MIVYFADETGRVFGDDAIQLGAREIGTVTLTRDAVYVVDRRENSDESAVPINALIGALRYAARRYDANELTTIYLPRMTSSMYKEAKLVQRPLSEAFPRLVIVPV